MSVREYIGARYVPLFADPIEWDNTKTYEPLTIVYYQGNSYTSRQAVPTGIAITNETYWALTGNYNAQIEAYREEVLAFDERITENAGDIDDIETDITAIKANNWVTTARIADENVTTDKLADEAVTSDKLSSSISDDLAKIETLDANDLTELVIIGDSYSTTGHDALENELWWKLVAKQLHLTPRNFAITGTGYTDPTSPNFAAQVQNAIDSQAFDNNKVKYVIIYGGRNDLSTAFASGMNYISYVEQTINAAITGFPNAQIIVAGVNTWVNYSSLDNDRGKTDWILTRHQQVAARDTGVAFINMLATLAGYPVLFGTGNHPNALGNKVIASNILNGISGNSVSGYAYKYWPITVISGTNPSSGLQLANINGIYNISGLITLDSNGESILELPYGHGIFSYNMTTIAGISNTTKTPIYMDRSGLTNMSQVKLHGPASERITIDAQLFLNAI